jgi:hypothetical protein
MLTLEWLSPMLMIQALAFVGTFALTAMVFKMHSEKLTDDQIAQQRVAARVETLKRQVR